MANSSPPVSVYLAFFSAASLACAGDELKDFVTRSVSIRIIHAFEFVDVTHDES